MITDIPRFEKTIGEFIKNYMKKYNRKCLLIAPHGINQPAYGVLLNIARKYNLIVKLYDEEDEYTEGCLWINLLTKECVDIRYYVKHRDENGDLFPFISVNASECMQYLNKLRNENDLELEYTPSVVSGYNFSYADLEWMARENELTDILSNPMDPSRHSRWLMYIANQRDLIARGHSYLKESFHRVLPFGTPQKMYLNIPRDNGILT